MPIKTKQKNKTPAKFPKVMVIFTFVLLLFTLFINLPIFRIQEIEIQGASIIGPEVIYQASGIKQNQHFLRGLGGNLDHLLKGRYQKAEEAVMQGLPEVRNIKISFSFPSRVIFEVEEKIEIGFIKIPDGYATIDGKGEVVSLKTSLPEALPIIEGITVERANLGEKLDVIQDNYLNNAMYAMVAIIEADYQIEGARLLDHIEKIEATLTDEIFLTMQVEGKKFLVQCDRSSDLVQDFTWLKQMMKQNVLADKDFGLIDLRGKYKTFKALDQISDLTNETMETSQDVEESELSEIEN